MHNKRIEFRPPEGSVPEGITAGEEFDSVCSFRVKADGQVCLVMLGDTQMPGYGDKSESKPMYEAPKGDNELSNGNNPGTY